MSTDGLEDLRRTSSLRVEIPALHAAMELPGGSLRRPWACEPLLRPLGALTVASDKPPAIEAAAAIQIDLDVWTTRHALDRT
jgi:hypothetical protein